MDQEELERMQTKQLNRHFLKGWWSLKKNANNFIVILPLYLITGFHGSFSAQLIS